MRNIFLFITLVVILLALPCQAQQYNTGSGDNNYDRQDHSVGHKLLMYIPNRLFDLVDIVRMRLRVGPGLAIGARVTTPVSAYLGSYAAIYAGLPGPRNKPSIPWPVGFESLSGVTLSVADAAIGGPVDPDYSFTEIGASIHLLVVGADLDVDPVEAFDLLAGLLFFDPKGDDL